MSVWPDIIEFHGWQEDCALYGLLCEYLSGKDTRLSNRANEALEWVVENRSGPVDFGGISEDGFVYLKFHSQKDAVLFKTFWL